MWYEKKKQDSQEYIIKGTIALSLIHELLSPGRIISKYRYREEPNILANSQR